MKLENQFEKLILRLSERYHFERLTAERKFPLIQFFQNAYSDQYNSTEFQNKDEVLKKLDWIDSANPNLPDTQLPAWICVSNERILGHFGIIPVYLKLLNGYHLVSWGRGLITLPEYRRVGIGPFLIYKVMEYLSKDTPIFMVGGLNQHVYTIYKKFGFIDMGFIPLYIRICNPRAVLQIFLPIKRLANILGSIMNILLRLFYFRPPQRLNKDIQIEQIFNFDEEFDLFWNEMAPYFPIAVKRDQKYLRWRFIEQPYWKYQIFKVKLNGKLAGYMVLRRGVSRGLKAGIITDLFAKPSDHKIISALINFAIRYFESGEKIDILRSNIMHKDFEYCLRSNGFIKVSSNTRFLFYTFQNNLDMNFIANPKNWFLTYADSDLDLS